LQHAAVELRPAPVLDHKHIAVCPLDPSPAIQKSPIDNLEQKENNKNETITTREISR